MPNGTIFFVFDIIVLDIVRNLSFSYVLLYSIRVKKILIYKLLLFKFR